MPGSLALLGVGGPNAGTSYDTDAQAYFTAVSNAGGSLTSGQKGYINTWFVNIKSAGLFTKLKVCYLYTQGVSAARDCINAAKPGTYDGTDTGSPTYNSTNLNVAFNGTSQYTNSNFTSNNNSTFSASDWSGFGWHRVDTNSDSNATIGALGGGNSYMQVQNSGFNIGIASANTIYNQTGAGATNNMFSVVYNSSTSASYYKNGTNLKQVTGLTFNGGPTRSILIGAFNNASPGFGGACTVDFHFQTVNAWSDSDINTLYSETKTMKAGLGVTWN